MLDYVKTILMKVSFDSRLFEKELRKAFNLLMAHEILDFRDWCYRNFSSNYEPVLNKYFIAYA